VFKLYHPFTAPYNACPHAINGDLRLGDFSMFKYHYIHYHSNKKVPTEKNLARLALHCYNDIMGLGKLDRAMLEQKGAKFEFINYFY